VRQDTRKMINIYWTQ